MTAVLVGVAGIVCLGAALMVWALCAGAARGEDAQAWAHDAEGLAALAKERARQEMADRVHQLLKDGRR